MVDNQFDTQDAPAPEPACVYPMLPGSSESFPILITSDDESDYNNVDEEVRALQAFGMSLEEIKMHWPEYSHPEPGHSRRGKDLLADTKSPPATPHRATNASIESPRPASSASAALGDDGDDDCNTLQPQRTRRNLNSTAPTALGNNDTDTSIPQIENSLMPAYQHDEYEADRRYEAATALIQLSLGLVDLQPCRGDGSSEVDTSNIRSTEQ